MGKLLGSLPLKQHFDLARSYARRAKRHVRKLRPFKALGCILACLVAVWEGLLWSAVDTAEHFIVPVVGVTTWSCKLYDMYG